MPTLTLSPINIYIAANKWLGTGDETNTYNLVQLNPRAALWLFKVSYKAYLIVPHWVNKCTIRLPTLLMCLCITAAELFTPWQEFLFVSFIHRSNKSLSCPLVAYTTAHTRTPCTSAVKMLPATISFSSGKCEIFELIGLRGSPQAIAGWVSWNSDCSCEDVCVVHFAQSFLIQKSLFWTHHQHGHPLEPAPGSSPYVHH